MSDLVFISSVQKELPDERRTVAALDFVMSKINRSVGTRALGPQTPVEYELPREAVAEAIVNAVAHRVEVGLRPPTFRQDVGCFIQTLWRPSTGEVTGEATPDVTPEVTPEVGQMLEVLTGEMSRTEIMAVLGLKDEKHFREHYQQAAVALGLIEMTEMTIPDKPRSSRQKYRLTDKGRARRAQQDKGVAR